MQRLYEKFIIDDLDKKMVFIGGPRQVGKTTLSKLLCKSAFPNGEYLNWDVEKDRRAIREQHWNLNSPLVIFDELHKYPRWKQWIKGVYDSKPKGQQYLVTGSARLDVYRRGGDSLMGRYHYWRLHPITLDEIPKKISKQEAYRRLMTLGGFPEPFLQNDERESRRWRKERFDRIIREDVRDLENIREIQLLRLFIDALRKRVGKSIVIANLARDLEISPKTAKSWLELSERMYISFTVMPYHRNLPRAIHKPPKVYFFDNADTINNHGDRLENLIATMLLKRLHFLEDYHGYQCQLHYIRDKEGREVDFITVVNDTIIDLIEVKSSETQPTTALRYYQDKLKPKRTIQIVGEYTDKPYHDKGILITNPMDFADFKWDKEL